MADWLTLLLGHLNSSKAWGFRIFSKMNDKFNTHMFCLKHKQTKMGKSCTLSMELIFRQFCAATKETFGWQPTT